MPWRVLIVEDSVTAREALVAAFQSRPEFRVVGAVDSGDLAVRLARRLRPDLMSLDVMLPDTDGITVIRQVLKDVRTRILVVSSRTPSKESPLALDALRAGAMEILAKPNLRDSAMVSHLLNTAAALCEHPAPGQLASPTDASPPAAVLAQRSVTGVHQVAELLKNAAPVLRPRPQKPRIVVMGASTGGPAALELILRRLPKDYHLPIVIAQHMTDGYAEGLVSWLGSASKMNVKIAEHGELMRPGTTYLAPDGHHIGVAVNGTTQLEKADVAQSLHVPSVDHLFASVVEALGSASIAVLLTGMGDDGAKSLKALRAVGAVTIAQDSASAFVFGMPHAAVQLDPGHLVLSLDHIAHYLSGQGT